MTTNLLVEESTDPLSFRRPVGIRQSVTKERSEANMITAKAKKYTRTENRGGKLYSTKVPF